MTILEVLNNQIIENKALRSEAHSFDEFTVNNHNFRIDLYKTSITREKEIQNDIVNFQSLSILDVSIDDKFFKNLVFGMLLPGKYVIDEEANDENLQLAEKLYIGQSFINFGKRVNEANITKDNWNGPDDWFSVLDNLEKENQVEKFYCKNSVFDALTKHLKDCISLTFGNYIHRSELIHCDGNKKTFI